MGAAASNPTRPLIPKWLCSPTCISRRFLRSSKACTSWIAATACRNSFPSPFIAHWTKVRFNSFWINEQLLVVAKLLQGGNRWRGSRSFHQKLMYPKFLCFIDKLLFRNSSLYASLFQVIDLHSWRESFKSRIELMNLNIWNNGWENHNQKRNLIIPATLLIIEQRLLRNRFWQYSAGI